MFKRSISMVLALSALALTAGCGQAPATAPKQLRQKSPGYNRPVYPQHQMGRMGPMAPGVGPMGRQGGPAQAEGRMLRDGAVRAFSQAKGLEAKVRSSSEGYYKGGEKVSELRKTNSLMQLTWVKPNKIRGEIIETDNALLEGGKLTSLDGLNVTARAAGFLGLFPMKMTVNDAKMRSIRNHPFKESLPGVLLERLTGPSSVWTVVGVSQVGSTPIKLVAVDNIRRLDNEIDREVVGIDPRTFQVRKITMYAGQKRVIDYTFETFRWDPRVSSDTFNM